MNNKFTKKITTQKILLSCCIALATSTTFANDTIIPPHPGAVPAYIDGQIFYPDINLNPSRNDQWSAPAFPADSTLKLHSRPGAKQTFFLDVDGHIETIGGQGAAIWNRQGDADGPVITGPIDLDGNPNNFNTNELIAIQKLWLSIAGSYAAYDINVTTEDPGVDAIGRFSVSDDTYGTRIVFGSVPSYAAASGGPDYDNVMTRRFNGEVAVPSPTYAGQITFGMGNKGLPLHESGHTISMYHPPRTNDVIDGQTISVGNTGLDSEVSWRSIMGGGVVTNLNHHLLPDLAGLYSRTVKQRPDDHGNTLETASDLMSYDSGEKLGNYGVIESNVDLDIFSFTLTEQQALNIHTQPAEWGHSLDALSMLFDSNGKELARSNPENHLDNWLNLTLNAGTYYLAVRGTGRAPTTGYHTGYLDFGSTGAYTVFVDFLNNEADAPVTSDDVYIVKKATSSGTNGLYTFNVLANDQSSNGPLKIVNFSRPSADIATNPGHTNSEYFALKNNQFQYKLRYSDFIGTDQFTYTVEDSKGYQQTADVTIHVQGQDQIFTNADRMQTRINQAVSINAIENDVVTTGAASISSVSQPTEGQVVFTAAGQLTYTPNDNFSGSDSFSYTASANGETSTSKVSVKVFPASGLILTNDQRTTSEDIAVPVHVLKNDSTLSGELKLVSVGVPSKGTATIAQDQSIEYTPNLNVSGQDEFTYQVSNGTDTESATVKIIIRPFNDNPEGGADLVSTTVNTAVTFRVIDNDIDVDNSRVSSTYFSLPKFGTLTEDRNRQQFTYTPNAGVCGSDKFTYNITDNNLGRGAAEVTINITGNAEECITMIPIEEVPDEEAPAEESPNETTEENTTNEPETEGGSGGGGSGWLLTLLMLPLLKRLNLNKR